MSQHLTSRYSFLALFCFAVSQRHVLARKSLAFHMNLFCMMRRWRVSFFAGRSLPQLVADQSAREIIRFAELALFRSIPKTFYPIVCNYDLAVLPRNDVAQGRGETIL